MQARWLFCARELLLALQFIWCPCIERDIHLQAEGKQCLLYVREAWSFTGVVRLSQEVAQSVY